MVPAGTSLTFGPFTGTTNALLPPDAIELRARVIDRLSTYFTVDRLDITAKSVLGSVIDFEWQYPYTATITVRLRGDYGSTDDVWSVIANAFYVAAGSLPAKGEVTHEGPGLLDAPKALMVGLIVIVALIAFSPLGRSGIKVSAL